MTPLWTSQEAAQATQGKAQGHWHAYGVSIDSRSIQEGDLFIALTDQRDGHDFVGAAFENGAVAAMVSYIPDGIDADAPLLIVRDVLSALEALAHVARLRTRARVIGITGSVGKTSTKDMLRLVLGAHGRVHAAEKSFNNHWGVPLTLARMPADCDFAVIEIGMNHKNEIRPLAKLADLDIAVVTTVAEVHMEAFDNIEAIAYAKAEIFEYLTLEDTAIINCDISTFDILYELANDRGAKICSFGRSQKADYQLRSIEIIKDLICAKVQIFGQDLSCNFQNIGQHFVINALSVLLVCDTLGLHRDKTLAALSQWRPLLGRGAKQKIVWQCGYITLIDESYNANPTSVAASLEVLSRATPIAPHGRRIAILGDMLELGENTPIYHAQLADLPVMAMIDCVYALGSAMKHLYQALPNDKHAVWFPTVEAIKDELPSLILPGDVVMVKGSKGVKTYKIAQWIAKE